MRVGLAERVKSNFGVLIWGGECCLVGVLIKHEKSLLRTLDPVSEEDARMWFLKIVLFIGVECCNGRARNHVVIK